MFFLTNTDIPTEKETRQKEKETRQKKEINLLERLTELRNQLTH